MEIPPNDLLVIGEAAAGISAITWGSINQDDRPKLAKTAILTGGALMTHLSMADPRYFWPEILVLGSAGIAWLEEMPSPVKEKIESIRDSVRLKVFGALGTLTTGLLAVNGHIQTASDLFVPAGLATLSAAFALKAPSKNIPKLATEQQSRFFNLAISGTGLVSAGALANLLNLPEGADNSIPWSFLVLNVISLAVLVRARLKTLDLN